MAAARDEKLRGGGVAVPGKPKGGRGHRVPPATKVLNLARKERASAAKRLELHQRVFDALPHKKRLDAVKSELLEWDRILRALGSITADIPAEPAPPTSTARKCVNCGRPAWARSDHCLSCTTDKSRMPGKHAVFGRCKCGRSRPATQDLCDVCTQLDSKKTA